MLKTLMAMVLLIMGIAVIAGYYLEKNSVISNVRFEGNQFTGSDQLKNAFDSPIGIHTDSVDYAGLISSVNTLPYVKNSSVSKGASGNLTVTVTERKPFARLIDNDQQSYVDQDGIKLPLIPEKSADVPLLYGFPVSPMSDTLSGAAFENVRDFLTEASKSDLSWVTISEVAWNKREGVVALSYENGVKLLFGKENFTSKIKHWEEFYVNVIKQKGIGAFESVDLRFRNQIVTHEKPNEI
ncbi:MAG TPA: cell division protein FtsQ/DivIB [Balneolaceae bacterium]|nr:cell division protein FtsQ/DivIB [Balneolaceae bacterium]